MKKNIYLICLIFASFLIFSCKNKNTAVVKTETIGFTKEGTLSLKTASDSLIKTLDIEFAETEYDRETGLMYRKSIKDNQGMLFIMDTEKIQSFYMKNTEISLDVIYINSKMEIVSFQKNTKPLDPTSLPSTGPAKYVLEIKGGLSDVWQLKEGDLVSFNKL